MRKGFPLLILVDLFAVMATACSSTRVLQDQRHYNEHRESSDLGDFIQLDKKYGWVNIQTLHIHGKGRDEVETFYNQADTSRFKCEVRLVDSPDTTVTPIIVEWYVPERDSSLIHIAFVSGRINSVILGVLLDHSQKAHHEVFGFFKVKEFPLWRGKPIRVVDSYAVFH